MRNLKLLLVFLFLSVGALSCNTGNTLEGKKLYALDVKLDAITIAEYELNFISSDKVEMKTIIYCNSMECLTKENSPKRFEKTVIKDYTYKDAFLKIEGIPDLNKISFLDNGDIKSNTGEILYNTSITELDNNDKSARVTEFLHGNKALGKVFSGLLNNDAPKALIEKTSNGKFKTNEIKSTTASTAKEASSKALNLFELNSSRDLIDHFGKENVKKQKAMGYEGEDLGYEYEIFPQTNKKASFYFSGDRLDHMTFEKENSYWQLPYQLKIGMSIQEVEDINEHSFSVNSLEIDESGLVQNWDGGKLGKAGLLIQFKSTKNEMTNDEYSSLRDFKSDAEGLDKLGLVVGKIVIYNPAYNNYNKRLNSLRIMR